MSLFHTPLVYALLGNFVCKQKEDGTAALLAAPHIDCYTDDWCPRERAREQERERKGDEGRYWCRETSRNEELTRPRRNDSRPAVPPHRMLKTTYNKKKFKFQLGKLELDRRAWFLHALT